VRGAWRRGAGAADVMEERVRQGVRRRGFLDRQDAAAWDEAQSSTIDGVSAAQGGGSNDNEGGPTVLRAANRRPAGDGSANSAPKFYGPRQNSDLRALFSGHGWGCWIYPSGTGGCLVPRAVAVGLMIFLNL
jgi:hypothetical protein